MVGRGPRDFLCATTLTKPEYRRTAEKDALDGRRPRSLPKPPGSGIASPLPGPLRTGRAPRDASGSSKSQYLPMLMVQLLMAVEMNQHQIGDLVRSAPASGGIVTCLSRMRREA